MRKKVIILSTFMIVSLLTSMLLNVKAQETEPLFTFHVLVNTALEEEVSIATIWKEELAKIGINLEIERLDSAGINDRMWDTENNLLTHEDGGWDLRIQGYSWKAMGAVWWEACYATIGVLPLGWNAQGWKNGRADYLLREGMEVYDFEERIEIYNEFQEIMQDEAIAIPIYWRIYIAITDAPLEGYDVNLQTYLWDKYEWTYDKDTVRHAVSWDPDELSPLWYDGNTWFIGPIYSSLMRQQRTPEGYKVTPDLAESYTISEDGLSITFKLREDVKWHDGEPFTSADVKFTIDLIKNPDVGSVLYGDIVAVVESVETPDEYTVVVHLNEPNAEAFVFLSNYHCDILPKHQLEDVPPEDIRTSIYNTIEPNVGTGPYKFVEYVEGEYFELEANPEYYGGEPDIKRIILPIIPDPSTALAAIENHEVDILSWTYGASFVPEIARLQDKDDINAVASFDRPGFKHVAVNLNHPILSNKWVRKALAHTIPYERVINEVMLGLVEQANSLVPPSHPFYNEDVPFYDYDLDQAREYLKMAGYPEWTAEPDIVEPQTDMTTIAIGVIAGIIAGVIVGFLVGKRQ